MCPTDPAVLCARCSGPSRLGDGASAVRISGGSRTPRTPSVAVRVRWPFACACACGISTICSWDEPGIQLCVCTVLVWGCVRCYTYSSTIERSGEREVNAVRGGRPEARGAGFGVGDRRYCGAWDVCAVSCVEGPIETVAGCRGASFRTEGAPTSPDHVDRSQSSQLN